MWHSYLPPPTVDQIKNSFYLLRTHLNASAKDTKIKQQPINPKNSRSYDL